MPRSTTFRCGLALLLSFLFLSLAIPLAVLAAVPVATSQSSYVFTDTPRDLTLDASDSDFDFLQFTIVDPPDHGTVGDCQFGSCTYTPTASYTGPDSFTWKANDGTDDSNVATYSLTIGAPLGKVLILDSSVTGGSASREANAAAGLGYTADVVDSTAWAALTQAQFDSYRAIILGDPTCGDIGSVDAAVANRAVWSPIVDGNVVIIGTDPIFHEGAGGGTLTDSGIAFAVDAAGKTGLYVTLSCYYDSASPATPVELLDGIGTFTVASAECFNDSHIVATHPALAGLDDAALSDWSCSVHEVFDGWPTDFLVLAIAEAFGAAYTAPDGTVGTPYILARGEGLVVVSDIDLTPVSATNTVGQMHQLTATVITDNVPVSGTTVTFTVISGPCTGLIGTDATDASGVATISYTCATTGTDTIKATFVDGQSRTQTSNLVTKTWVAGPVNTPPTSEANGPYSGQEGSAIAIDGTATDADAGDTLTYLWSYASGAGVDAGATCSFGSATSIDTTVTCTDDGTYTLTLAVSDGVNTPATTDTAALTVTNANPSVSITSPADASVFNTGATVNVSATFTDAGSNDTHTCLIDWGDSSSSAGVVSSGTCTGSHSYAAIGVYTITVTVTDDDGGSGSDSVMVVISDASVKVTGGGWIAPGGGRYTFGFVAKGDAPSFQGQIQIRAPGRHRFHGDVVLNLAASGNAATWTGTGRWDGAGGYSFEVSVVDNRDGGGKKGTPDTISITVRDGSGSIVLSASGPLKGGNIKVH